MDDEEVESEEGLEKHAQETYARLNIQQTPPLGTSSHRVGSCKSSDEEEEEMDEEEEEEGFIDNGPVEEYFGDEEYNGGLSTTSDEDDVVGVLRNVSCAWPDAGDAGARWLNSYNVGGTMRCTHSTQRQIHSPTP